jgi:hypothetical protein
VHIDRLNNQLGTNVAEEVSSADKGSVDAPMTTIAGETKTVTALISHGPSQLLHELQHELLLEVVTEEEPKQALVSLHLSEDPRGVVTLERICPEQLIGTLSTSEYQLLRAMLLLCLPASSR